MNRETERAESRAHMNRSGGLIKAWSSWLNPGSKVHQSLLVLGTGFRHPASRSTSATPLKEIQIKSSPQQMRYWARL